MEGLEDVVAGADVNGLHHEIFLTNCRDDDDLGRFVVLQDLASGVQAALLGHDDVHRHEVGPQSLVHLDGLRAVLGFAHDLVVGLGADIRQGLPDKCDIIDDQHGTLHPTNSVTRSRIREGKLKLDCLGRSSFFRQGLFQSSGRWLFG